MCACPYGRTLIGAPTVSTSTRARALAHSNVNLALTCITELLAKATPYIGGSQTSELCEKEYFPAWELIFRVPSSTSELNIVGRMFSREFKESYVACGTAPTIRRAQRKTRYRAARLYTKQSSISLRAFRTSQMINPAKFETKTVASIVDRHDDTILQDLIHLHAF